MTGRKRLGMARCAALAGIGVVAISSLVLGCTGRSRSTSGLAPSPSSSIPEPPATPDISRPHVAELDLSRGIPESYSAGLFGSRRDRTFAELIGTIRDLRDADEHNAKGVFVRFGSTSIGMARAQELAAALVGVRNAGVPVVCHAEELTNASYWVAAVGCDRLWMSPAGGLDTVGIAMQVLYARKLLGELKIDVDMLQIGKFKGAEEPMTRDGPSDEARESIMSVLGSMRRIWLDAAAKRLKTGTDPTMLEQGPYSPLEAKDKGLVDAIGYVDEAMSEAERKAAVDQTVTRFGPNSRGAGGSALVSLVRVLSGSGGGLDSPHVALVRAVGGISMRSASILPGSEGITESNLSKVFDKIIKDKSARAIVVRIDSPGGSALASDLIWHRLMELRKTRPVIVSVGDMAASGGYYLACTGTKIFAEPTSIVGSIGVVGGKLAFGHGLEHLGVHAETFVASDAPGAKQRAAYLSPFETWDDSTRERVRSTMKGVYDLFVQRVAEGRKLNPEKVAQFAEGRIFTASEGLGLGMVDELGGIAEAIDYARRSAGLADDAPVRLVGEEAGLEEILGAGGDEESERARSAVVSKAGYGSILSEVAPDLVPFARSFAPMAMGEHALVAVPFAFLVR